MGEKKRRKSKPITAKKRKIIISVCLILVITSIVFLPSLKNNFTNWDDPGFVTENTSIRDLSWNNVKKMFTSFYKNAYIPLTIFSYSLEYHFFELDPRSYHTTNLILHVVNCLLVFLLIYILSGNIYVSLVTALLFGLHPLRVEAVAWVTGRKDVLYSFFYLGSLIFYLYYRKKEVMKYYYLSIFTFILSVMAKGMAVTFPFVLLLFDYFLHRKFRWKTWIEKIPFFVITTVFGIIAILGERSFEATKTASVFMFFEKILIASYGLVFYLSKTIMPVKLSCYYPYPEKIDGSLPPIFFFSTAIIIILIAAVIFSMRYTRKVAFGSLFFLIVILPYLQLIPAGQLIADRFTYISSIGLLFIVTAGIYWFYIKKLKNSKVLSSALFVILIGIISTLSVLTWQRCRVWEDSMTLWSDVLKKYPNVPDAYNGRGLVYYENGENDKAISDFTQVIKIDPKYVKAYYNRANAYDARGEYGKAIADFTQAAEIHPEYAQAYNNRGLTYGRIGDYERAIADFNQALRIDPEYAIAYNNRGLTYGRIKEHVRAINDFTQALNIDSKYIKALRNRAIAYFMIKEYDKSWQDVKSLEGLGYQVSPEFLGHLRRAINSR